MLETILTGILSPLLLTVVSAYCSYRLGRRRTKEEIDKEKIENNTSMISLLNSQFDRAQERISSLEEEVTTLRDDNRKKEDKISDFRFLLRQSSYCPHDKNECPIRRKQAELDKDRKQIKEFTIQDNDITITKED